MFPTITIKVMNVIGICSIDWKRSVFQKSRRALSRSPWYNKIHAQYVGGIQETKSLAFISSDLKHNYHTVHHFTSKALSHPRGVRVLQWTDGYAAQYKSKGHFTDITNVSSDNDDDDDIYNEPVSFFQVCIPDRRPLLWCFWMP